VQYVTTVLVAESGYVADANYVNWTGAASAAYDAFSNTLKLVETSDYWDENNALIIANPAFRDVLRQVKDNNGTPIFVQGQGNDSGQPDTLFGVDDLLEPWRQDQLNHESSTPGGNPLLVFVGDRNLMKLGVVLVQSLVSTLLVPTTTLTTLRLSSALVVDSSSVVSLDSLSWRRLADPVK
jgi:hypothetical protein